MSIQIALNTSSEICSLVSNYSSGELRAAVDNATMPKVAAFMNKLFEAIADVYGEALNACNLTAAASSAHVICPILGSKDLAIHLKIKENKLNMHIGGGNSTFSFEMSPNKPRYLIADYSTRKCSQVKLPVDATIYLDENKVIRASYDDSVSATNDKIHDEEKILKHFKASLNDCKNQNATEATDQSKNWTLAAVLASVVVVGGLGFYAHQRSKQEEKTNEPDTQNLKSQNRSIN